MESGGFPLRKWSSNEPKLLAGLATDMLETQLPFTFDTDKAIKTLGIKWSPTTDQFSFKVQKPPCREIITKRTLLSDMSKVFDPLGWLGPVTIRVKILFQQLWLG